jgi:hypothetical protein
MDIIQPRLYRVPSLPAIILGAKDVLDERLTRVTARLSFQTSSGRITGSFLLVRIYISQKETGLQHDLFSTSRL